MAENPLAPPRDRQLLEFFCRQYGLRPGEDRLHTLGTLARSFSQLPYENLTKIIRSSRNGKGPAARRLPTQVLTDHRDLGTGGTCFSLTATLLHLVRSLGFRAQPILADRHYGSDTHSALLVWLRGRPHLLDPGYLVVEPIPLEESREVEVKTPFNRLLLSPESPERMRLYTRQQGGRSHRLTFKTSPADPGQFLKAWDESFSWEMMTHPLLTRVQVGETDLSQRPAVADPVPHRGRPDRSWTWRSSTGRSPRPSESPCPWSARLLPYWTTPPVARIEAVEPVKLLVALLWADARSRVRALGASGAPVGGYRLQWSRPPVRRHRLLRKRDGTVAATPPRELLPNDSAGIPSGGEAGVQPDRGAAWPVRAGGGSIWTRVTWTTARWSWPA